MLLFVDEEERPVQLLTTQQLKRVAVSRLCEPAQSHRGRADLGELVRGVRWRQVYCPLEGRWWYYRLARLMHPREYRELVSFGPAWFLHVDWGHRVPELRVTERVWCQPGEFAGPWPVHKACQQALEGLWDLFELCRYPEQVRRTPHGVPCAYADMGRCDAPCDGSAPLQDYINRARAAWRFACGGVDEWVRSASERMRLAAANQRYELAGLLKHQLEFAEMWRRRWLKTICSADELNYFLAIPATRRKAWKLFLFSRGRLADGPLLSDRRLATDGPPWLTDALARPPEALDETTRMEQTWLVAHFLQHREARAAIIEHLPDARVPGDLAGSLSDALRRRRDGSDRS